jgi:hypothetical protein
MLQYFHSDYDLLYSIAASFYRYTKFLGAGVCCRRLPGGNVYVRCVVGYIAR